MTELRIHQIYYSEETKRLLDPGFIPLDNTANERPDWREYWPIRNYLKANELQDDVLYGFLSPKFGGKGGLTASQVKAFIEAEPGAELYGFSPLVELSAFFLNPFEQGDAFMPGLLMDSWRFFEDMGIKVDLRRMLNDTRSNVFCNYFIANARFWRAWFGITEKLFAICESNDSRLGHAMNDLRGHGQERVPLKVFVLERIANVVLARDPSFETRFYCPFDLPRSTAAGLNQFPDEVVICDALKIAYKEQGYRQYLEVFQRVRDDVFIRSNAKRTPA